MKFIHSLFIAAITLSLITVPATLLAKEATASSTDSNVMDNFDVTKVAEHTWVVLGPTGQPSVENKGFMNNPPFVITDKSVIVIDPGSSLNVGRGLIKKDSC